MGELGFCTITDIFGQSNVQFLRDVTTDVGLPIWFIRLFHNKFFYTLFFSFKCYFQYLDTVQFTTFISILILPGVLLALIGKKWRQPIWFVQICFPLLLIINPFHLPLGERISVFRIYYTLLAAIGFFKFVIICYQTIRSRTN